MKYGYVKVAAATPEIKIGNVLKNENSIKDIIDEAVEEGVNFLVFPELCVSGKTVGDMILHSEYLSACEIAIQNISAYTEGKNIFCIVGTPVKVGFAVYDAAAVIFDGEVLGVVPKKNLNSEDKRFFKEPEADEKHITFAGFSTVMGELNFTETNSSVTFGITFFDTLGFNKDADVVFCLGAEYRIVGSREKNTALINAYSGKKHCAVIYANAGEGESTTDYVFAGGNIISENGKVIAESMDFSTGLTVTEVDTEYLAYVKRKRQCDVSVLTNVRFQMQINDASLTRYYSSTPFIPSDKKELESRAELIFNLISHGLKTRAEHINAKKFILGLSGGQDSTLALLALMRTVFLMGLDKKAIIAITMPCFGTTGRTKNNAVEIATELGVDLREINIANSVRSHFFDISQPEGKYDVTFENAQARERTQVIMDIANKENGIAIGTGDLSESALGWCTFGGDHLSSYTLNCSVPKTLIKYLIAYEARKYSPSAQRALIDVIDTPISPELLPTEAGGVQNQKTEDSVGPYVLHDFFIDAFLRKGFSPSKILFVASYVFEEEFEKEEIEKWLRVFVKRFISQQFKRNTSTDGVKIGSIDLSPRGELVMPSDLSSKVWLDDLDF